MNHDELLAFLVQLTSPIGPEIFAGYGSQIENRRAAYLFAEFEIIEEWSAKVEVENTLKLLFDIAIEPPEASFMNNYYGRFQEVWNNTLFDLVCAVGRRDPAVLKKIIKQYESYPSLANFIHELRLDLSGDD